MAVQIGKPMLLADSIETFDALIEPILAKAVTKRGANLQIKIGEDDIEYSEDFSFFITTKLSKPHFAPEVCVLVNVLNMMVTETGLLDQMLTQIIVYEEPKLMDKKDTAIRTAAENNKKKGQLEDTILNQIATSEVDILENDVLMNTLNESKQHQKVIAQQEQSDKNTLDQVDKLKDTYHITAVRVSRLFFVLMQIMNVNSMYQYSLKYFKGILHMALHSAHDRTDLKSKEKRKNYFRDKFTELLYTNICRSLFEVDKLLFSFLMCLKIKDEET